MSAARNLIEGSSAILTPNALSVSVEQIIFLQVQTQTSLAHSLDDLTQVGQGAFEVCSVHEEVI